MTLTFDMLQTKRPDYLTKYQWTSNSPCLKPLFSLYHG